VAREVETLGIVGVLVLVIIAMAFGWAYTVRALTRQGLVFAEELGRWMAIAGTAATRARKAEQRVAALDERIDRMTDRAPPSRRGEG
jgi:TRAP-type C4-dicarboxylate transport system permease small subunit